MAGKIVVLSILISALALSACTAREVASGAVGAGAGYVVGKNAGD